jgi:hypothetical protein
MPDIDPRLSKAIADGQNRRELGIQKDKEQLKEWFEKAFWLCIADRVAENGRDWCLTQLAGSPFIYVNFMRTGEVILFLYENYIKHVKGFTASLLKNDHCGEYISVTW